MNEDLEFTPEMEFFRDINNYVLINNDICRKQCNQPDQLNPTPVTKSMFKTKFGFSEEDWLSLQNLTVGLTNQNTLAIENV